MVRSMWRRSAAPSGAASRVSPARAGLKQASCMGLSPSRARRRSPLLLLLACLLLEVLVEPLDHQAVGALLLLASPPVARLVEDDQLLGHAGPAQLPVQDLRLVRLH